MACSMTFTKRYNPAKAYILIEDGDDDISPFRISFTEECKDCGICVRYCSYGALKIKGEG
jgi:ferredoxin